MFFALPRDDRQQALDRVLHERIPRGIELPRNVLQAIQGAAADDERLLHAREGPELPGLNLPRDRVERRHILDQVVKQALLLDPQVNRHDAERIDGAAGQLERRPNRLPASQILRIRLGQFDIDQERMRFLVVHCSPPFFRPRQCYMIK